MRFQVGDIVRLSKDHSDKRRFNYDMIVTRLTPDEGIEVFTSNFDGTREMGWFESSLRLVRREQ